ncbi:uncharacterized protein C8Q71DRAFT_860359 [Rhodofomes roseus]|nr:uncharacterized protein C8Q71DRAFT_860359 [Rhodofomes roseus]KAH9833572.1 hypothetical protein C8Q71DRAFT_860359 [Rhodofomes roseus]
MCATDDAAAANRTKVAARSLQQTPRTVHDAPGGRRAVIALTSEGYKSACWGPSEAIGKSSAPGLRKCESTNRILQSGTSSERAVVNTQRRVNDDLDGRDLRRVTEIVDVAHDVGHTAGPGKHADERCVDGCGWARTSRVGVCTVADGDGRVELWVGVGMRMGNVECRGMYAEDARSAGGGMSSRTQPVLRTADTEPNAFVHRARESLRGCAATRGADVLLAEEGMSLGRPASQTTRRAYALQLVLFNAMSREKALRDEARAQNSPGQAALNAA